MLAAAIGNGNGNGRSHQGQDDMLRTLQGVVDDLRAETVELRRQRNGGGTDAGN